MQSLYAVVWLLSETAPAADDGGGGGFGIWPVLFIILALHIAQYALFTSDFTKAWILTGTFEILVRNIVDGFAGGAVAIWAGCGLLVFSTYIFAESRFRRIEVPPQPKLKAIEVLFSN